MKLVYCERYRIFLFCLELSQELQCRREGRECFRCPQRVYREDGRTCPEEDAPWLPF